ncbi:hypothetical protein B1690_08520 [Geobacillus sp. 46C-IIa]|uniref:hypothetical protein n=1 Tax=Geobacillus sp. 46C-IIa TaxID=1963025 RepID=UPI0009F145D0|nr:hypothetical protein [Geobacillus sp. 46C-IIa]OQP06539.1 hypothetical protein B1690_08520 [Geobacillus sp. 46C-IIa]QNU28559.1 hypothetical protein IC803_03115 [Geobacillus sp. 46C-IIa]
MFADYGFFGTIIIVTGCFLFLPSQKGYQASQSSSYDDSDHYYDSDEDDDFSDSDAGGGNGDSGSQGYRKEELLERNIY